MSEFCDELKAVSEKLSALAKQAIEWGTPEKVPDGVPRAPSSGVCVGRIVLDLTRSAPAWQWLDPAAIVGDFSLLVAELSPLADQLQYGREWAYHKGTGQIGRVIEDARLGCVGLVFCNGRKSAPFGMSEIVRLGVSSADRSGPSPASYLHCIKPVGAEWRVCAPWDAESITLYRRAGNTLKSGDFIQTEAGTILEVEITPVGGLMLRNASGMPMDAPILKFFGRPSPLQTD